MNRIVAVVLVLVLMAALSVTVTGALAQGTGPQSPAAPIGSAFTYQGQLQNGSGPVTGPCDFQFGLWNAATLGAQVGVTQTRTSLSVNSGLFTTQLDFGAMAFDGNARWLAIAVRCPAGSGGYTGLTPRQTLTAAPYASTANRLSWGASWTGSGSGTGLSVSGGAVGFSGSGSLYGVQGQTASATGYGVYGRASSSQGSGVYGYNPTGRGVRGESTSHDGVAGFSTSGSGVYGQSQSGTGLFGSSTSNTGVHGGGAQYGVHGDTSSNTGYGVYGSGPITGTAGIATAASGWAVGVYGRGPIGLYGQGNTSVYGDSPSINGTGIYGVANSGSLAFGVWGVSNTGYAGYFNGKVHVQGDHSVSGTLTVSGDFSASGTKAFKIDHPLNPDTQYLYHYAIEAPEVQNMYNGTMVLDAKGEAVVTLPDYFAALNTGEFRYTLTAVGAPMPNLYIAQEVSGNTFKIAGGVAGKKVSWTVLAQRSDPWLRDHPATDVVDKSAQEAGTYLYPQGYGQPESKSLNYTPMKPLGGQ